MSFSGNAEVSDKSGVLHFKGKAILDAILADLKITTRITSHSGEAAESQKVILSGGSAGASAVFWHADYIADTLALGAGKVAVRLVRMLCRTSTSTSPGEIYAACICITVLSCSC